MNLTSGKIWPYAIGLSIILIFGACVATIVVASTLPVEKSDLYMTDYHDADKNANELIESRIAFDEKYKVEYVTSALSLDNSTIKYMVTDKNSNLVSDAEIVIVVTRPNNHKHNQEFKNPTVSDGVYSFSNIKLPLEGRWDVMAKINVGEFSRYFNVKADTRYTEAFEY